MTSDDCVMVEWDGRKLFWPLYDTKLKLVNDWVYDVDAALEVLVRMGRPLRAAVQAGGACGIWPLELAKHFAAVFTYEPDPLNYFCLERNVANLPHKIAAKRAALGEHPGLCVVKLDPSEKYNAGAGYTVPVPANVDPVEVAQVVRLDDEPVFNVDLICLDVEGREIEALRGANSVIEQWQPIIMIEEKPLPQMGKDVPHQAGAATEWLQKAHNYRIVKRVHRDVILAPPE